MTNLNENQILTWQEAYNASKVNRKSGIAFGSVPMTKDGKAFFAPFLKAGYINANCLKYTGMFVLTDKGISKFEELLSKV
jgi:hypothetical protein